MTKNSEQISTTDPNEGQILKIAGGDYRILISGEETNGDFAVIEMTVSPGGGPNAHSHAAINESFFVLEGEISFQSESGKYVAKKSAFVNIPTGGIIHGFKNLTDKPAKLLCTVMPAGLDNFFREMADVLADTTNSELVLKEKVHKISEKYGQKLYPGNYFERNK